VDVHVGRLRKALNEDACPSHPHRRVRAYSLDDRFGKSPKRCSARSEGCATNADDACTDGARIQTERNAISSSEEPISRCGNQQQPTNSRRSHVARD